MSISFADRIEVPDEVLISGLQGESVILNLDSERYFGLDEVGTRMLSVLNDAESIQAAFETLREEYDVEDEILRRDLISIIEQLVELGVVKITHE
jgi:Coenzyme PQQ synthesis protein D (PqqD)